MSSRRGVPYTMPVRLSSFIGREADVAATVAALRAGPLVTLVGTGGVGKTRLAEQVVVRAGAELAGAEVNAVCWVDLVALTDSVLVPDAVLSCLGLADTAGRDPVERIRGHLAGRQLLLVLDNCEHLRTACATLAHTLLPTCPGLTVLATSREPLGLDGEATIRVQPLSLPEHSGRDRTSDVMRCEAGRLFVERATSALGEFRLTEDVADAVSAICVRLDGIPLALELAAARTLTLSPRQIQAGLTESFRLLSAAEDGRAARHRALEASVAWSYDLLDTQERDLFRRLSVCAGSFDLEAVRALTPERGEGQALDLLQRLVARSLVVADTASGPVARYRFYESVREFAAAALRRAGQQDPCRDAHLEHYRAAAVAAGRQLVGVTADLLARLALEQDNYRSALDHAVGRQDTGAALDIAAGHGWLLVNRGRYREAGRAARRALDMAGQPPAPRAAVLWVLGGVQWASGDLAGLETTAAEMLELARAAEDASLEGRARILGCWLNLFVSPPAARAALAEAQQLAERAGDAWVLMDVACESLHLSMRTDDMPSALAWFARAQELADRHDSDWFRGWNLVADAFVAARLGDLARARTSAERGISIAASLGDTIVIGFGTAGLARVELLEGRPARALELAEPVRRDCESAAADVILPWLALVNAEATAELQPARARAALTEAAQIAARVGDPWQQAPAALALARQLIRTGDLPRAAERIAEARASGAAVTSPWTAATADQVEGLLALAGGAMGKARDLTHRALAAHHRQGFPLELIECLETLARLASADRDWTEAAHLLAAAATHRRRLGYRASSDAGDATTRSARTELGAAAFDAAWAAGEALGPDEAVAYATRGRGERRRPAAGWDSLTPTELAVARLAAQGLRNVDIAAQLLMAPGTVKAHLARIYSKLGLANRTQLTAEVTRRDQ